MYACKNTMYANACQDFFTQNDCLFDTFSKISYMLVKIQCTQMRIQYDVEVLRFANMLARNEE